MSPGVGVSSNIQGVPKKVSIRNFNSDLFITLIHSFLISLDSLL